MKNARPARCRGAAQTTNKSRPGGGGLLPPPAGRARRGGCNWQPSPAATTRCATPRPPSLSAVPTPPPQCRPQTPAFPSARPPLPLSRPADPLTPPPLPTFPRPSPCRQPCIPGARQLPCTQQLELLGVHQEVTSAFTQGAGARGAPPACRTKFSAALQLPSNPSPTLPKCVAAGTKPRLKRRKDDTY